MSMKTMRISFQKFKKKIMFRCFKSSRKVRKRLIPKANETTMSSLKMKKSRKVLLTILIRI